MGDLYDEPGLLMSTAMSGIVSQNLIPEEFCGEKKLWTEPGAVLTFGSQRGLLLSGRPLTCVLSSHQHRSPHRCYHFTDEETGAETEARWFA